MKILYVDTGTVADQTFAKWEMELSVYRREKAEKLRFESDRKLSAAAGRMLAILLMEYGITEADCRYETSEHGKLRLREYPELSFNISHSGQIAVAVICPPAANAFCGIDIEPIRPARYDVAKRFFSDRTYERLRMLAAPEADVYFTRIWTKMEAYGKCLGTGLNFADPLLKNVSDEELMQARNYFFREYHIYDCSGTGYIMTACVNDRAQAQTAKLCRWSD